MIQEKDFLYRVPVKTAPITTPRGQIRNPEILVDLEGGEFMHGNILDANSTNKLINISSTAIILGPIDNSNVEISRRGIKFAGKSDSDILTANGGFIDIDNYVGTFEYDQKITELEDSITSLTSGLKHKQDKIKVNSVDVTNLNKANIDQLINIVQELLIALDSSGLIIMEDGVE